MEISNCHSHARRAEINVRAAAAAENQAAKRAKSETNFWLASSIWLLVGRAARPAPSLGGLSERPGQRAAGAASDYTFPGRGRARMMQ